MATLNEASGLFACPRCDQHPLETGADTWQCPACRTSFPLLDGVPALFAEPAATLGEWRNRLHLQLVQLEQHAALIGRRLGSDDLLPTTRQRLELLQEASLDHRRRLAALLAPLTPEQQIASHETHLALRTRLPADQGLTTYYSNIHRDWAWGEAENQASLALVLEALGDEPPGPTLVLGAGAGRLAFDLHQASGSELLVALDFNPLLMLLLNRLARGESVSLWEFPLAPRYLADSAVLRELRAPQAATAGLMPVLADAHRPPFAPGSFSTIVTPWVVDILPEELALQARRINRLLAAGGRWINFGSLAFSFADPARCLSVEEALAVVAAEGFGPPQTQEAEIPYMCSPASRHGRREQVLLWKAVKNAEAAAPERHRALPDWLVTGREPVPLLSAFESQLMSTRIHLFIMGLVDGRRTLKEMAALLEEQRLMTREEAEPAIRGFLLRMYEDSLRGQRL